MEMESSGFSHRDCGLDGETFCMWFSQRLLSVGIDKDFGAIGDGNVTALEHVGALCGAQRYERSAERLDRLAASNSHPSGMRSFRHHHGRILMR